MAKDSFPRFSQMLENSRINGFLWKKRPRWPYTVVRARGGGEGKRTSRERGAGLFKRRNCVQTASLKFLRHPALQLLKGQLWASTQREIRLFNGFTEFGGFREEEGGGDA